MKIERRSFLEATSGSLLGFLGLDLRAPVARAERARVLRGRITSSICPYCAVGCGTLITASDGKVVNVEGDPDHPINGGSLCAKGTALAQVADNPRRLTKVKYRPPGGTDWVEKDWDWAIRQIARRVKSVRDATFETTDQRGRTVNRTEAIACLGGGMMNNEECYLEGKLARALGIVYLEHQARICHSSTVAALATSFGRGAMTNHWIDLANSSCVMIIGSNVAENHPIAMKWLLKARDGGAKLISVDPRFTRTSAVADIHAPIRPGTDVAFIGGLINYAIERDLIHREYLAAHTNAAFLVDPAYRFEAGRFGAVEDGRYTRKDWAFGRDEEGHIRQDPALQDPRCVFQLLKRHFGRYTLETVSQTCGTPVEKLRLVAQTFTDTCRPDRAGSILYAMGSTQHTHGTQNIRAFAVLQLLLGNIGIAGGGINAARGQSNVQGSTDHGLLFDQLPGYLTCPTAEQASLDDFVGDSTPTTADPQSVNCWKNHGKYAVSLLKAWWGDHADKQNQFCYDYLPKRDGDRSYLAMFRAMGRGEIRGLFAFGQNPAVSGPDAGRGREALGKLDWLVAVDLWETETAAFWKRPGAKPEDIQTEVFLLPGAASMEKEGSITNSGRWAQWRLAAVDPPGDARSDLWIIDRLAAELKRLYATGGTFPDPIVKLDWTTGDAGQPDPHVVAGEINGRFLADVRFAELDKRFASGDPLPSFALLRDDGSTACGNWLYSGSYTAAGNKMARRRTAAPKDDPLGLNSGWAWAWPANRRVLYNRAGCDTKGQPWAKEKAVVTFDWRTGRWTGDVPDGGWPPPETLEGEPHPDGKHAFIMLDDGRARLFAPRLADGPFPEHYEPMESPTVNPLSPQQVNPMAGPCPPDTLGTPEQYPIVATTCRVSEHWLSGPMSRNLPWLVELVPNAFVEMSPRLAAEKGISNGDLVTIRSARGQITVYALVTGRLGPLKLGQKTIEQVAIVWHFGYQGLATGDSANILTLSAGDADSMIPEYKAFLCDVDKAPEK